MVTLLKTSMPDLETTGVQESGLRSASFQCTYTEAGKRFRSEVLVVKQDAAAHWFSYSAPEAGYDQPHGLELLQGMIGSIAAGNGSQPPPRGKRPHGWRLQVWRRMRGPSSSCWSSPWAPR